MKQRRFKLAQKVKEDIDDGVYIDLDLRCSCPHSHLRHHNNAAIQFTRRYLHCQSSMPLALLRSYIQLVLPHSSATQVLFFDGHDRPLADSAPLASLKPTSSSSSSPVHVPVRFTLLNTITSLAHCSCSSTAAPPPPLSHSQSCSPAIIKRETIEQTLSTCPPRSIYSPCVSSSSSPSPSLPIVNLLTPPSSCASDSAAAVVRPALSEQAMIDEITSQFGEICPPPAKVNKRKAKSGGGGASKKTLVSYAPLDLSLKKLSSASPFDIFASQSKWITT